MAKGVYVGIYNGGSIYYDRDNPWYTTGPKGHFWCPLGTEYVVFRREINAILGIDISTNIRVQFRYTYFNSESDFGYNLMDVYDTESLNLAMSANLLVVGSIMCDVYIDIVPKNTDESFDLNVDLRVVDYDFHDVDDIVSESESFADDVEGYTNMMSDDDNLSEDPVFYSEPLFPSSGSVSEERVTCGAYGFFLGKTFASKQELKLFTKQAALVNNFVYKVIDSDKRRWKVKCVQPNCMFEVGATVFKKNCKVWTVYNNVSEHNCCSFSNENEARHISGDIIATNIDGLITKDPCTKISAIIEVMKELYGNREVSYSKAWRAKESAIRKIFGDWVESYNELPHFMNALKGTNPGSVHRMETMRGSHTKERLFKRNFFAFNASIQGFKHCRPVVVIDATHLRGKYNGKLFTAVGQDANGGIFPLAFGFAETECKESWGYFLENLYHSVVQDREELCVISDRHLGIIAVFESGDPQFKPPRTHHRFCMRHVQSNFQLKFKQFSSLYDDFWELATTTDIDKFNAGMMKIKVIDDDTTLVGRPKPYAYLMGIQQWKWTMLFDEGKRYGVKTTNPCEVFNAVLKGARAIPITAAVESIFKKLNTYFLDRHEKAENFVGEHVPDVYGRLKVLMRSGRFLNVQSYGGNIFLVWGKDDMHWTVDMNKRTCSCRVWGLTKFPCAHAVSVVYKRNGFSEMDILEEHDTLDAYKKTWAPRFVPIPHKSLWGGVSSNRPVVVPDPETKRNAGTQKHRRKNEMDVSRKTASQRCGQCNEQGHSRNGCPFVIGEFRNRQL